MTPPPQTGSRRQNACFSNAWGAFAQSRPETRPAGIAPPREDPAGIVMEQAPDAGNESPVRLAAPSAIAPKLKSSFAESCFNALSHAAFLALPLLLLVPFAAVGYNALTPWLLPQEAGFAQSYEFMSASGQWFMGSAAIPPLWFWLLRLLDFIPYVNGHLTYVAGAVFSGVLTLLAAWFLAISVGYDRRTAFASGLALLSCLAFPALAHRVGPELFAAGLMTLGLACLVRGWNKENSFFWLPLGCSLAALAGLANGLFCIILAISGSLIFLAWKGSLARLNSMDGALAFAALLALPLAWLGAAMLFGEGDTRLQALCSQLAAPFMPPYWPPKEPLWFYAATLPAALMPWISAPLFVPWSKVLNQPFKRLASTRKDACGSAWIWIHLVAGFLLLSIMNSRFCLNMLPLMPLLAIALGKAIVNLPQTNSRAFFLAQAGLFGLAALASALACLGQAWPSLLELCPFPFPAGFAAIRGLPILAGICLLTAIALWKLVDRRFPGACLLLCAAAITALCVPALKLTSPSMQDIFLNAAAAPESIPGNPPAEPAMTVPTRIPDALPDETPSAPEANAASLADALRKNGAETTRAKEAAGQETPGTGAPETVKEDAADRP